MIGALAPFLKTDFRGELIQRTLLLAQDPSFDIRKRTCGVLALVIRNVDACNRPKLLEEVVRLIGDDEAEVRKAAITLLGQVLDVFDTEEVGRVIVPLVTKELIKDTQVRKELGQISGRLLRGFQALREKSPTRIVFAFYKSLQTTEEDDLRLVMANDFPSVLQVLYTSETADEFLHLLEGLWTLQAPSIRSSLCNSIHEVRCKQVIKVYNASSPALESLYLQMLQDPLTFWDVALHVADAFPYISGSAKTSVIQVLQSRLVSTYPWRKVGSVLSQIQGIAGYWKVSEALEYIQPGVLKLLQEACWQLRLLALDAFIVLILANYYRVRRTSACSSFAAQFGKSDRFQDRILFIEFCLKIVKSVSKATFEALFFPLLISLSDDPISNVRLHLVTCLLTVGRIFSGEEGWSRRVGDVMQELAEDLDTEVSLRARTGLKTMGEAEYWAAARAVEAEDAAKIAFEAEQDQREASVRSRQEQEELRRVMMQELTRKARMDYQEQYKESTRRSTSRSKVPSNRTTPTRVKKRSSMSQEKVPNGSAHPRPVVTRLPLGKIDIRSGKRK